MLNKVKWFNEYWIVTQKIHGFERYCFKHYNTHTNRPIIISTWILRHWFISTTLCLTMTLCYYCQLCIFIKKQSNRYNHYDIKANSRYYKFETKIPYSWLEIFSHMLYLKWLHIYKWTLAHILYKTLLNRYIAFLTCKEEPNLPKIHKICKIPVY